MDPLVLGAKAAGKLMRILQAGMETLYDGIIPPLLGYQRLQSMTDLGYDSEDLYATESHNNSGLYLWEREAIDDYLSQGKRFMVLAAGGGREVIDLLRNGIQVDAWECNETLRRYGNQLLERLSLPCRIQPMTPNEFPSLPKGTTYDFCIVGWSAYSHILRQSDRVALLAEIKEVVQGPVLISFPANGQTPKLKKTLRNAVSLLPGTTKDISYDLHATPGTVAVGFDQEAISEEAASAGFVIQRFKNHHPEYPYALLVPSV